VLGADGAVEGCADVVEDPELGVEALDLFSEEADVDLVIGRIEPPGEIVFDILDDRNVLFDLEETQLLTHSLFFGWKKTKIFMPDDEGVLVSSWRVITIHFSCPSCTWAGVDNIRRRDRTPVRPWRLKDPNPPRINFAGQG